MEGQSHVEGTSFEEGASKKAKTGGADEDEIGRVTLGEQWTLQAVFKAFGKEVHQRFFRAGSRVDALRKQADGMTTERVACGTCGGGRCLFQGDKHRRQALKITVDNGPRPLGGASQGEQRLWIEGRCLWLSGGCYALGGGHIWGMLRAS